MQGRALHLALFGLGFAGAVAVLPGTLDAVTTLRWAIFAVGVPLLLLLMGRSVAPIPKLVWAFVAFAALSILWAPSFASGLDDLAHVAILAAAFWLGASLTNANHLWLGVATGVAVSTAIALGQWGMGWSFESLPNAAPPSGLFANRNFLAEAAMVALIPALAIRTWPGRVLAAAALIAVMICASKAVLGALIVTGALWITPRRPAIGWSILAVMVALFAAALAIPIESAAVRFPIWSEAISGYAPLGHGVGSFAANFPVYEHAHSEPLQLFYEFGLFALIPALVFLKAMEGWSGETEGFVLVAVAAVGLFSFPLQMPLTGVAAALAAGRLAGARDRLVRRRLEGRLALGVGA